MGLSYTSPRNQVAARNMSTPRLSTPFFCIGEVYVSKGALNKVMEYYDRARQSIESQLQAKHKLDPLRVANDYLAAGADASEMYQKSLRKWEEEGTHEKFKPEKLAALHTVAEKYVLKKHCPKDAVPFYLRAACGREKALAKENGDTWGSYNNLGGAISNVWGCRPGHKVLPAGIRRPVESIWEVPPPNNRDGPELSGCIWEVRTSRRHWNTTI